MPRLESNPAMSALELSRTLGSASPTGDAASRLMTRLRAAGPMSGQPAGLLSGRSAIIASRPPRYGSETAVQPPACAYS